MLPVLFFLTCKNIYVDKFCKKKYVKQNVIQNRSKRKLKKIIITLNNTHNVHSSGLLKYIFSDKR